MSLSDNHYRHNSIIPGSTKTLAVSQTQEISLGNRDGIQARIRKIIGGDSVSSFAKKCGLTESVIRSYLGGTVPSATNALAISRAAHVSLEWLIAGEETKKSQFLAESDFPPAYTVESRSNFDENIMAEVIEIGEETLNKIKVKLTPSQKKELLMLAYRHAKKESSNIRKEHISDIVTTMTKILG